MSSRRCHSACLSTNTDGILRNLALSCCSLRLLPFLFHCRTVNGDCLVSLHWCVYYFYKYAHLIEKFYSFVDPGKILVLGCCFLDICQCCTRAAGQSLFLP